MAALNATQVAALALEAGLPPERAARFVAIAAYESGGGRYPVDSNAHNPRGADDSYGIWQINMKGSLGPERRGRYGLARNEDLYDPRTNARVMAAVSNRGTNETPWTTRNLPTAADMTAARQAVADAGGAAGGNPDNSGRSTWDRIITGIAGGAVLGPAGAVAGAVTDWLPNPFDVAGDAIGGVKAALDAIGSLLSALTSWSTWARVLQVVAGAALVTYGLLGIARDTITEAIS